MKELPLPTGGDQRRGLPRPGQAVRLHWADRLFSSPTPPTPAGHWSSCSPAARTTSSCMGTPPSPRVPPASSPHHRPCPSPRRHHPAAGGSSPSTSPSSRAARPWIWPRSAVAPTATPACTRPCHPLAKLLWTPASSTCPAASPTRSQMRVTLPPRSPKSPLPSASRVSGCPQAQRPRRLASSLGAGGVG